MALALPGQRDLFPYTYTTEGDRDCWATPRSVFDPLNKKFRFTLDVCAEAWSAKCERFWTRADDALSRSWACERAWMNPPYSLLEQWTEKAFLETREPNGPCDLVVGLLPVRTSPKWFHRFVDGKAELKFFQGRIPFIPPPGIHIESNRPLEDSMLVIWRPR